MPASDTTGPTTRRRTTSPPARPTPVRKPSKKWPEVEPWSPENYGPAAAITNLRTTVRNEGRRAQRMAVESFRAGLNWEPVRNGLFWAGHAALTAAAVLMSGPVWFAISLAGPSNPFLWAPTLAAASLRLGFRFCTLFRHALVDGKLEPIEAVTIFASFSAKCLVTVNALLPQPMFITIVGGGFSSGDAARAGHLRISRSLWRATADLSFRSGLLLLLLAAGLAKLLLKAMRSERQQPSTAPSSGSTSFVQLAAQTPAWLRKLALACAFGVGWALLAARAQALPLWWIFGIDPTRLLSATIPDWLLMGRHELSLFHNFSSAWPSLTAWSVAIGDALMSNPSVPGGAGATGCVLVYLGIYIAGQPLEAGFWLASAAWFSSLAAEAWRSWVIPDDDFEMPESVELGGIATVELEDDEDDAVGPAMTSAAITFSAPPLPAIPLPWYGEVSPWPEDISLDTAGLLVLGVACGLAFMRAPLGSAVAGAWWFVWHGYISGWACLPWLPNN